MPSRPQLAGDHPAHPGAGGDAIAARAGAVDPGHRHAAQARVEADAQDLDDVGVLAGGLVGTTVAAGHTGHVKIIDEMLSLDLLSTQQHREISLWVRAARTPEAILAMPPHLWRAIEAASVAMNVDADLTRPPWLGADLS
jgi:hypothetical protein